ncbi:MAG: hypothetical protein BWY11_02386 [Firmicutes bacterium ADurb.Bin182]|nr:MAG: hypothetical protein BWY11_02386 [Firmicutes bacterium ADurb.Bin182]
MKKFLSALKYVVLIILAVALVLVVLDRFGISVLASYAQTVLPYSVMVYALLNVINGIFFEKKKFGEVIFNIAVIISLWALCL